MTDSLDKEKFDDAKSWLADRGAKDLATLVTQRAAEAAKRGDNPDDPVFIAALLQAMADSNPAIEQGFAMLAQHNYGSKKWADRGKEPGDGGASPAIR